MKERCRRLTADAAAKTAELLNANLREPRKRTELSAEVTSCLSCHGKELHDTMGKMQCTACHQQLSKQPPLSTAPSKAAAFRQPRALDPLP
jgi:cytochrome c553